MMVSLWSMFGIYSVLFANIGQKNIGGYSF